MEEILEGGAKRKPARRPATKKSAPRRSAPRKSAPRKSAPRRSAPRRSAPRRSAPRKSSKPKARYVYKNGRKYVSGYYKGLQKLSVTAAARALQAEGRQRAEYLQARLPPAAPAARAPARDAKPIGCVRQYTKHYTDRPSPPYPASACIGSVKVGNDGQLYTSKRVADGMQGRWMLNKDFNLQELNADMDFGVAYVKFTLKNERTKRSRLPTIQELQYVVQREVLPMLLNGYGITASIDSYNFHGETGLVAIGIDKKNFPVAERDFKSGIESVDDDGNYEIPDGQGGWWRWHARVRSTA